MGITAVVAGAVVGGGLLSAKSQLDAGKAGKNQASAQADILKNNALIRDQQAVDAAARGKVSVQRNQTEFAQLIGTQRATLAGNGILVGEGSAVDLLASTERVGREEQIDLELAAEREAMALTVDAANLRAQAKLVKRGGKNIKKASDLAAAGTLISTTGTAINAGVS